MQTHELVIRPVPSARPDLPIAMAKLLAVALARYLASPVDLCPAASVYRVVRSTTTECDR
jgi:hypothetical protein